MVKPVGVFVPVGTKKIPSPGTLVFTYGHKPDLVQANNSDPTDAKGVKVASTSPRITIKGTKWSPNHPYIRTASELITLPSGYAGQHSQQLYKGKWYTYTRRSYGSTGLAGYAVPKCATPLANADGLPRLLSANETNRLITELILKAGKRQWSLGESIAESGQTLRLISHTASRLVRSLLALRRGRIGEIPKILGIKPKQLKSGGTLSQYWLEYQYGWMPLMNDLYDAHEVFQKGLSRPQLIRAVRRIKVSDYDMSRNSSAPGDSLPRFAEVTGRSKLSAQAIAYYRLEDEYLTYFQQLGLINPAEVAWAVVPFSFVLDWFIPIQNVLEATTATVGLKFIDGCVTTKVETSANVAFKYANGFTSPGTTWTMESPSPQYKFAAFGMRRTVLSTPTPGFYTKSPFSTKHAISALALLRQLKR